MQRRERERESNRARSRAQINTQRAYLTFAMQTRCSVGKVNEILRYKFLSNVMHQCFVVRVCVFALSQPLPLFDCMRVQQRVGFSLPARRLSVENDACACCSASHYFFVERQASPLCRAALFLSLLLLRSGCCCCCRCRCRCRCCSRAAFAACVFIQSAEFAAHGSRLLLQ